MGIVEKTTKLLQPDLDVRIQETDWKVTIIFWAFEMFYTSNRGDGVTFFV